MSPPFPSSTLPNPSSSSSSSSAPSSQIHATNNKLKQQHHHQGPRGPFRVLNGISFSPACNSASVGSDASSASTDAPTGCLRFFLSHSSSSSKTPAANKLKPSSKNPKSTSHVRPIKPLRSKPLKENALKRAVTHNSRAPAKPCSTKLEPLKKNSPRLYRWPSGKKPCSLGTHKSKILASDGEELEKHGAHSVVRMVDDAKCEPSELSLVSSDFNFTPMREMENGSGLDPTADKVVALETSNKDHSKTPPVQASVSPELQCGSALMPTLTPVCYGAGYVVSGVSDKRKCRPRGVLIVGNNTASISNVKPIQNFVEDGSNKRDTSNSVVLKVPSPIEASMNWLLSPCNEEDEDHQDKSENASPSSINALPPDFEGFMEPLSFEDISPSSASNCLDVILTEGRGQPRYEVNGENSPFSIDSLSSDNVIRTPQSDSNSPPKLFPPCLTADSCDNHDQNSASDSHKAMTSITDLSFKFDCLATISNSMDLNQFQKLLEDQAFRNSNSSCENLSKSQMRVSWREGLMSRMYEMDEFDSCRCLSDDEEENADTCSISMSDILNTPLKHDDCEADPIICNCTCSPGLLVNEEAEEYDKSNVVACCCAESISTDGGGLIASGDSDWHLCYKNGLFDC